MAAFSGARGSGPPDEPRPGARVLLTLAGLAVVAGVAIGFVGGAFRWLLAEAEVLQAGIVGWARGVPFGWLVPIAMTAAAAALATLLVVRLAPRAIGSGIQDVEAVQRGEMPPPPLALVPVRFVGGLLSIGSGLVLGREGPTVHMGAALGASAARAARMGDDDVRGMQTSLSGAGLAVAFNAPIAGALFVLEEIARTARLRIVVPTIVSVAVSVACARLIMGDHPDFQVADVADPPLATLPLFVAFGVAVGLVGAGFNGLLIGMMQFFQGTLRRIPRVARAAAIGALVGAALFLDPLTVGGGDALTQLLLAGGEIALPLVVFFFLARLLTGPLSYSAGTPGGIFAPLLALGALLGVAFADVTTWIAPGLGGDLAVAAALVGMSALFAAVVRAPVTGIVLVIELTGVTSVTVPMLLATASAVVVATIIRSPPVYDSLRALLLRGVRP